MDHDHTKEKSRLKIFDKAATSILEWEFKHKEAISNQQKMHGD